MKQSEVKKPIKLSLIFVHKTFMRNDTQSGLKRVNFNLQFTERLCLRK